MRANSVGFKYYRQRGLGWAYPSKADSEIHLYQLSHYGPNPCASHSCISHAVSLPGDTFLCFLAYQNPSKFFKPTSSPISSEKPSLTGPD